MSHFLPKESASDLSKSQTSEVFKNASLAHHCKSRCIAAQRSSPTVPRRHNKCCINHCVSPGRQQCIMNDWCLALLLHVLMQAQGSFSWNNSFDDPGAGGRVS